MSGRVSIQCVFFLIASFLLATARAEVPVEAFAQLPTFSDVEIAPGGGYFAARINQQGQYQIIIFAVEGLQLKPIYSITEDDIRSVSWFEWISEERMLLSVAFTGVRFGRNVVKTEERRLMAFDAGAESPAAINLFPSDKRGTLPVQIQDDIVSLLPSDPDHILVQYRRPGASHEGIFKINITQQTKRKRFMRGKKNVYDWMADKNEEIRLGSGFTSKSEPYLIVRGQSEKKWRDISHRKAVEGLTFIPLAFGNEGNHLYVKSNHEGDPVGLYKYDILSDSFVEEVFRHPSVDVAAIRLDPETNELLKVLFIDDDIGAEIFAERPVQTVIDKYGDQSGNVDMRTIAVSDDGHHAVVKVSGERDPGKYVLLNGTSSAAISFPPQYPGLQGVQMGKTIATEYSARDGLTVPAYVTLPPGTDSLEDAKNLPFIIRPHGGPTSRDFLRFNYHVQFLASRGYGVLQMNFRGSSGYGREFEDAGDREWGQAMQDDITDGVAWLVEAGVADAERIAIVGGSYGGYAALMGVVKTPDLYQCAISFAGVSDLPDLLQRSKNFAGGTYGTRHIGNLWRDRKMLANNSPARRAEEIQVPVMLVHGNFDTRVDISQSKKMAKQLERYNKSVRFVEQAGGDHHHSRYKHRLQYLVETETFLADCLN